MKFKGLFAMALLLGAVMLSGCSKGEVLPENMGNTDENISNVGSVCQRGNTTYYQNDKDGFAIYKSENGGEGIKLNSGTSYFINVVGDYVYYVHESDDFHVFRMKTDGSENTELIKQAAYYMTVFDNYIYYVNYDDNQTIYRANIDGSEPTKIIDGTCYYPIIADNALYYVDYSNGGKVTRANIDGTNPRVLDENNPVVGAYLNYYDGKLYYTNATSEKEGTSSQYANYLFSYDLDKETTSTVLELACADINVHNGRVYYSNLTDNKVYSCDLEGNDIQLEYDNNGMFINTTDDSMYCYVKLQDEEPFIQKISTKKTFMEKFKELQSKK